MKIDLIRTIYDDCKYWEELMDRDTTGSHYLYLYTCGRSRESGLYQLILNGRELWYGTLPEINAVVKSMIYQIERAAEYGLE